MKCFEKTAFEKTLPGYYASLVLIFTFVILTIFSGCTQEERQVTPLSTEDFRFDSPLGSDGAQIVHVDTNHFKVTLDHPPNHPEWPNKLNFEILQNAKGNNLTLEVEFDGSTRVPFNEYAQSWSYDGTDWQPAQWKYGGQESPLYDILELPVFEEDKVYVGTQVPMSFENAEIMKKKWEEHPHATLHTIGESIQGRPLYRLEITDATSPVTPENRWVHYFANQHPGEHNSQWRMVGMVDWILSEEGEDFRQRSISHFIFFMSPDGPTHGWYRVNAEGVDMNRSYRAGGSDREEQTHEAYFWQKDLEELMASDAPVTTIWSMHTWGGIVEPLLRPGPEIGSVLGPWEDFRDAIIKHDSDSLVKPLALREGMPGYGTVSWTEGPNEQFDITAILCEGAGAFYTKEKNIDSGKPLIKGIAEYYEGTRSR